MAKENILVGNEYWEKLIAEQQESGLSAAQFCRERGVSRSNFYSQVGRLKRSGESKFVPVVVQGPSMRLRFSNGAELVFTLNPDADWLVELIGKMSS